MFKFLRDKLGKAIDRFTKKAEEEPAVPEEVEAAVGGKKPLHPEKAPESLGSRPEKEREKKVEKKEWAKQKEQKRENKKEKENKEKGGNVQIEKPSRPADAPDRAGEHMAEDEASIKGERKESGRPDAIEEKTAEKADSPEKQERPHEEHASPSRKAAFHGSQKEEPQPAEEKRKGFFSKFREKVTKTLISDERFEDLFYDIELTFMENNVAVEVIEKIKQDLRKEIVNRPMPRKSLEEAVISTLKDSIRSLLSVSEYDLVERARAKKPYVICFVGINGSGKTTTIAKIAKMLKDNGLEPVIAASDTFRAAAIDQLTEHSERLGVKLIKHDYGSDAAAVAFDAVSHARSKGKDVVLIDTAGRMHSNSNLMDELKKIIRVAKPDMTIFVGESITGNDCVEQATIFNNEIGLDGLILTKADIDEKGGAPLSISYVTKKPILFVGTGQGYSDLVKFEPALVTESLGI